MSKRPSSGDGFRAEDAFLQFLEGAAKLLFWGGVIVAGICAALLVYTFFAFATPSYGASLDQAASNIGILQTALIAGMVAVGVGSAYLYWGEEVLGAIQLIGALLFYLAPLYVPILSGSGASVSSPVAAQALSALQTGGMALGVVAIIVLVIDLGQRMRLRALYGSKADALKFGKNVKKEYDFQNVFMGKCWQLPYCRKFVREKCPVFHARTTCWRERVGCMCEEDVIRAAMEGRAAPKDPAEAFRMIPYNNTLSANAKTERCRSCVIYNEHQKHKYRLAVTLLMLLFVGIVIIWHEKLLGLMAALIAKLDQVIGVATYREGQRVIGENVPMPFQIALLACILVVLLTYCLRALEFLIFKAKI